MIVSHAELPLSLPGNLVILNISFIFLTQHVYNGAKDARLSPITSQQIHENHNREESRSAHLEMI